MRVAVGGDHAGFEMKKLVVEHVKSLGHTVVDAGAHEYALGAYEYDALDDFPDFSEAVAVRVADGRAGRGLPLVVCGSGVGASVAANKVRGVRAGLCHDTYSARQGVEHDDMNVVCIGARIIGEELAKEIVTAFLSADCSGRFIDRRGEVRAPAQQGARYRAAQRLRGSSVL